MPSRYEMQNADIVFCAHLHVDYVGCKRACAMGVGSDLSQRAISLAGASLSIGGNRTTNPTAIPSNHDQTLLIREEAIQSILRTDGKIRVNTSTGSFEIIALQITAPGFPGDATEALKIAIDDLLGRHRARTAGEVSEELDQIKQLESARGPTKYSSNAWLALSFFIYGGADMDTIQCISIRQL